MRIADCSLEDREEVRSTLLVLDEREHLLELVEDQHELGAVAGQYPLERAQQSPVAVLELLDQAGGRLVGNPKQRRLELLERIGTGEHLHCLPVLRARQCSPPQRRDEAGANHRRLAATAGADDGEEARLGESCHEVLRQLLAPEEVGRIPLFERA